MATAYFCPYCGADNPPGEKLCRSCQQLLAVSGTTYSLLHERYEVLTQIGSGGFGAVYKARDTREGDRFVAVKQINLAGLSAQEVIEATDAFNREAQILSTLNHPLLPQIFDRFSDPEHWYLVMNCIDGQTLDEYLQEYVANALPVHTGLPLDETLAIGLRLCDALHYLHSQQPPVIFRDLKPGNIMRTASKNLYLIDFGIARRFKPGQARDTIPFGSPGFAAPEQYGRAQTTPQADIYSLGALLYCLLTGDDPSEHPFHFPPLRFSRVNGTRELEALIQRMVALDPKQRPANIQEVQSELQNLQDIHKPGQKQASIWSPPQGQTPPDPSTITSKKSKHTFLTPAQISARKTTRRNILIGGIVAAGVLASGYLAATSSKSSRVRKDQNAYATGYADGATKYAIDIKKLAAVPANGPTYWSPDFSHAAVINTTTQQLELYKVQGKQLLHTIKPKADLSSINSFDYTIQWTEDNSKILLASDTTLVWDVKSGRQLFTLALSQFELKISIWSPTGEYLAIGSSDQDKAGNLITDLTILRANDGQRQFQASIAGNDPIIGQIWSPDGQYLVLPDQSLTEANNNGRWSATIWNSHTHQQDRTISFVLPSATMLGTASSLYLSWSPGGDKLAISFDGAFWVSLLKGQQATYIFDLPAYDGLYYGQSWSPDGKYLAGIGGGSLIVLSASSGLPVQIKGTMNQQVYLEAFAWSPDSKNIIAADDNNVLSYWSVG